jgi:hypothetical protein
MHLIKYIQKYKIPIKLLHVSAPRCHHHGLILRKEQFYYYYYYYYYYYFINFVHFRTLIF